MKRKIGIYKITNKVNGMVYIGQSKDIHNRLLGHKRALRNNSHRNAHLQHAYNMYGRKNFMYSLLQECDEELLDKVEVFWIKQYHANDRLYGYNIDGGGGRNREVSLETREKLRNHFEGEKSRTATITEKDAVWIVESLIRGDSIYGIAKKLGISHKIVEAIRIKKTWKYLTENIVFPEKRSSQYAWVTRVKTPNYDLYRGVVRVNGKNVYAKCWDNEYDAAVAREIYIREHNLKGMVLNFPENMPLTMPIKQVHGKSKFYGVCKQSGTTHWVATVGNTYIGSFKTQIDAAKAREKYIKENNITRAKHNRI